MKSYTVGTQITMTATFKDVTGALVDPTAVTCELLLPDLTLANPAPVVTRASLGVYTAAYTPVFANGAAPIGLHQYRFIGTGTVPAAQEGAFLVESDFSS